MGPKAPGVNGTGGAGYGGGILFLNATAGSQLQNDTIFGNSATGGSGQTSGNASGGGIEDASPGLTIVNVTVASNSVAVVASGRRWNDGPIVGRWHRHLSSDPHLNVYNTLIAQNTSWTTRHKRPSGPPRFFRAAAIANSNLLGEGTGATGFSTPSDDNLVGTAGSPVDPLFALAGLINNGGNTRYGGPANRQSGIGRGQRRRGDLGGIDDRPAGDGLRGSSTVRSTSRPWKRRPEPPPLRCWPVRTRPPWGPT